MGPKPKALRPKSLVYWFLVGHVGIYYKRVLYMEYIPLFPTKNLLARVTGFVRPPALDNLIVLGPTS